jgi:hypothetical protein
MNVVGYRNYHDTFSFIKEHYIIDIKTEMVMVLTGMNRHL